MMDRPPAIRIFGDPVLETVCDPVPEAEFGGAALEDLAAGLFAALDATPNHGGVGLAAPQIGVPRRVMVVDVPTGRSDAAMDPDRAPRPEDIDPADGRTRLALVNPVLLRADGIQVGLEGCLSIPGVTGRVSRPASLRVRYATLEGRPRELAASGLLARVILHERDHLNGTLFLARLEPRDRKAALRRIQTLRRRGRGGWASAAATDAA